MFAPYPFREHDHRNNALPLTLPSIVRPGCKNEERTEIEKEKERKREKEREREFRRVFNSGFSTSFLVFGARWDSSPDCYHFVERFEAVTDAGEFSRKFARNRGKVTSCF